MWDKSYWQQYARSLCSVSSVVHKDDYRSLFTTLSWLLFFWSKSRRYSFVHEYAQTLGPIQFYPLWGNLNHKIVAHECEHVKQAAFLGWFVPVFGWTPVKIRVWVGLIPLFLAYCLFPFPVGVSYFRYRLELKADVASWKQALLHGYTENDILVSAYSRAETVAGAGYLWSWPYSLVLRGYLKEVGRLVEGVS